jgi:hypothetical protein
MSAINRWVIGLLGVLLVLGGALVTMINTELLGTLLARAGSDRVQPDRTAAIVPPTAVSGGQPWLLVIIAVVAVLVAALAVCWLLASLPRRNPATAFRVHQDPVAGTTIIEPAALNQAVAHQVEQVSGAIAATVSVRGAVQEPHLAVRVTVDERADIAEVVRAIGSDVAGGLALALDHTIERLAVLVDIDRRTLTAPEASL